MWWELFHRHDDMTVEDRVWKRRGTGRHHNGRTLAYYSRSARTGLRSPIA